MIKQAQVTGLISYPLVIDSADKHSPFLDHSTEIHRVQRNDDLSDLVVLRKAIEVIDGERQRLRSQLRVRQLYTKPSDLLVSSSGDFRTRRHGVSSTQ